MHACKLCSGPIVRYVCLVSLTRWCPHSSPEDGAMADSDEAGARGRDLRRRGQGQAVNLSAGRPDFLRLALIFLFFPFLVFLFFLVYVALLLNAISSFQRGQRA